MPSSKIFFGKASPHPSIISESNSIYFCGKEEGEKIETSQLITRIESPGANFTFIRRRGQGRNGKFSRGEAQSRPKGPRIRTENLSRRVFRPPKLEIFPFFFIFLVWICYSRKSRGGAPKFFQCAPLHCGYGEGEEA